MLNRAREWWEKLGRTNQLTVALTGIGVLVTLIGFVVWAGTPEYKPLFSSLSAQDANAITEKLKEAGVPNRLVASGTTIEVPAQSVDEWHMKMLSQGLPHDTSAGVGGTDDLIKPSMIMTSPVEQVVIQRSQEARVAKSIMSLQQVASATVHLAAADNGPMVANDHPSSASVVVICKPGNALGKENVQAILRLTQMSFTGLDPKNISIVDGGSNVLWDGSKTGLSTEDIGAAKEKEEKEIREKLQTAFALVVGPHSTVVTVTAEMDTNKQTTHSELPQTTVPIEKTTSTETLNGKGDLNGKAPGVGATSNLPAATPPATPAAAPGTPGYTGRNASTTGENSSYISEQSHTINAIGKVTTDTEKAPGTIKSLAVSVFLDKNHYKDPAELSDAEAKIKTVAATCINAQPNVVDPTRLVTVVSMPFDRSAAQDDMKLADQQMRAEQIRQLAGLLVPFAIMVIALFLLSRALRRQVVPALTPALEGGPVGALPAWEDRDSLSDEEQHLDANGDPIGDTLEAGGQHTHETIEVAYDSHLETIREFARTKPETVALLMKSWVSEEL